MLAIKRDAFGAINTLAGPPAANATFMGGLAFSPLGELYTTSVTTGANWVNGFLVSPLGELVIVATPSFQFSAPMVGAVQGFEVVQIAIFDSSWMKFNLFNYS